MVTRKLANYMNPNDPLNKYKNWRLFRVVYIEIHSTEASLPLAQIQFFTYFNL